MIDPVSDDPATVACKRRLNLAQCLLLVTLLVVAVAALVVWLRSPSDPLYKSKRISAYLYAAADPFPAPPTVNAPVAVEAIRDYNRKQADAEEATKALGVRAVPLLTAWWESDDGIHEKLRSLAMKAGSRFTWLLRWRWISIDLHAVASNVLSRDIPEHAGSLLTDLRKRMLEDKPPRSDEAARLFARILNAVPVKAAYFEQNRDLLELYVGRPTSVSSTEVEVMAGIVRHGPPEDAEIFVRRLWPYRQHPFGTVERVISNLDGDGFIQNLLYLEDGKPTEKPAAALYFRHKPRSPERVLPLLTSNLTSTASANLLQSVCEALTAYGTNAAPALPALTNLLSHPKPAVREAAERAVGRIGGR